MVDVMKRWLKILFVLVSMSEGAMASTTKKILIVFSGVDFITDSSGRSHETGYWLEEFSAPYKIFSEAQYEVTFATPNGNKPSMDPQSVAIDAAGTPIYWPSVEEMKEALEIAKAIDQANVLSLSTLTEEHLRNFDAMFFPGGHAPTEDLAVSLEVARVLRFFHKQSKVTALVCHAPVALLSTSLDGEFLYKGYRMTAYSNSEETQTPISKYLRYTPETALKNAGATYVSGPDWQSFVVEDRELITGQNPASSKAIASALVKRLSK